MTARPTSALPDAPSRESLGSSTGYANPELSPRSCSEMERGAGAEHRIIIGDSLTVLPNLPSESVALIVTSPPYFNARDYAQWVSYESFLEWCSKWISECSRVLKPGRMFCVNVSPVIVARESRNKRSQRHNLPGDIHGLCGGLWFAEDITWEKPEGAASNRSQRFSLDRHPMQWRANPTTERILVYQKPTKRLNDHIIREQDTTHRIEGAFDRGEVWRMNPETSGEHPAPFPVDLPKRLIRYYTWPGETVLDPFAGNMTTLLAAHELGRRGLGVELSSNFAHTGQRRLSAAGAGVCVSPHNGADSHIDLRSAAESAEEKL